MQALAFQMREKIFVLRPLAVKIVNFTKTLNKKIVNK